MRFAHFWGIIDHRIKFMPAPVSWWKSAVCMTVADVPYDIRSLYFGLAVNAISVVSVTKSRVSDSDTFASFICPW